MKEFYTLVDLRNWKQVAADLENPIRLGVFGDPVAHSLSPQMQNAALEQCGLKMRYARFHIPATELETALRFLPKLNFVGVNLTVPHKIAALKFLDQLDNEALAIGAANTVLVRNGKLLGFNTDGGAMSAAISDVTGDETFISDHTVLLLGAGGAARAITRECIRVGCPELFISNRTLEKAQQLRDEFTKVNARTAITAIDQSAVSLRDALVNATIVINATSVGMRPEDPSLVPREMFGSRHLVYDTIYSPSQTSLLREAEAAGARVANGLSMLLHQGARAFQIWFNREPPIGVMRRAL